MPKDDRIPDPRDRPFAGPVDLWLPEEHPGSLAAFEEWCQRQHRSEGLRALAQYRRHIANAKRRTT